MVTTMLVGAKLSALSILIISKNKVNEDKPKGKKSNGNCNYIPAKVKRANRES